MLLVFQGLPWNTDIIKDRFTPQCFQVQLVELLESTQENILVLTRAAQWLDYLKILTIKQHAIRNSNNNNNNNEAHQRRHKLIVFVANMGADVSRFVELISKHTTLKLAGIDAAIADDSYCMRLREEAQILIMSAVMLLDWLRRGLLATDDIHLVVFDQVNAAFHNPAYKMLMDGYLGNVGDSTATATLPLIVGFGSLDIQRSTTRNQVHQHIDFLKQLFK